MLVDYICMQYGRKATELIDKDGYQLLADMGFDTRGVVEYASRREKLKRELKRKGYELFGCEKEKDGFLYAWFEVRKNGQVVKKSKGVKFEFKK